MTSRIPGFYRLQPSRRLDLLDLEQHYAEIYRDGGLTVEKADMMVENVISTFSLPCAVAVNFTINGEDRLVPMVVEEPSVVAAVSNMAKLSRLNGGFQTEADPSRMIGQIQLRDVSDTQACVAALEAKKEELLRLAHHVHPRLHERGGGITGIAFRTLRYEEADRKPEDMVVVHFTLDCVDAMGANMVNTVAEVLAPTIAKLTGERVGLKILSNLADQRIARARVRLAPDTLATEEMSGSEVAERIASAWRFAWADPYRATTHNKGIMNGIDALTIASGNDWRAVEAGAHAWCARDGQYRPLTRWEIDDEGHLVGSIAVPLQLGTVGGSTRLNPTVQANMELMGNPNSRQLSAIAAAVGLAQNLGALKALATHGIQKGHMRMHARSVAATAGAAPHERAIVIEQLCADKDFSIGHARRVLAELRLAK
jgi:hydroxymethylglutaryl-CoA reductase